ncbi:MAG: DUF86 domain-containing protein [Candidatus Cloacimonadota bacterium]|nr:DUF86 domain-containing protein [Candidatus Cloacimonadota bacterium]
MLDYKINDHLQRLVRCFNGLKNIRKRPKSEFLVIDFLQASSERYLKLAIESCMNIGNSIILLEQFNKKIPTSRTNADIFIVLSKIGVIDEHFSFELIRMIELYNRLEHIYWNINKEEMYNIIQTNLGNFKKFIECVIQYYNKKYKVHCA